MIKEVLSGIYRIEVPLPRNPLRALNSYLVKGREKSLLVDTGFNWPVCREALSASIEKLGVPWERLDYFITHMHGDHCGLVSALAARDSVVYCSRTDADLIRNVMTPGHMSELVRYLGRHGFPKETPWGKSDDFVKEYISGSELRFRYVEEGEVLEVGDYRFTCVMTPGHTPGHVCLYEPSRRFLLSGDHVLDDITSNITVWMDVEDSLGLYLESLDKISGMEIDLVLPGHRSLINDCRRRIEELKHHHQKRMEEIEAILRRGAMTSYQVAGEMKWDIDCDSWDQFPIYQKWFATGEAMAHLEHLVHLKKVTRMDSELILYQKSM
ncbi:MAG: MBL fold metallo-hydrolase [Firmicutes bacterium]|nr:MBL fold metallo-hydrolase [Bacillota bacterium]